MPFPFRRWAFTHRRLERSQLCSGLKTLEGADSFPKEIRVSVLFIGFLEHRLHETQVFLKVFRRAVQEMLEVEPWCIISSGLGAVTRTLLHIKWNVSVEKVNYEDNYVPPKIT